MLTTVTGNIYLFFGTLFFSLLALAVSWIPPRGNMIYRVARLWSRALLFSSGVSVDLSFERQLNTGGPWIFMANHRSLIDIPVLIATLPTQTRFLAKKGLFSIPFFGWALGLAGFVPVDRGNRERARGAVGVAIERLNSGVSIVVFPEGTRSPGGGLLPLRRGGFLMALKSGTPIVPVGIRDSDRVLTKGNYLIRPGTVTVCYGAPVEMDDYSIASRGELVVDVTGRLEELTR